MYNYFAFGNECGRNATKQAYQKNWLNYKIKKLHHGLNSGFFLCKVSSEHPLLSKSALEYEWIYDNYYIIENSIKVTLKTLKTLKSYNQEDYQLFSLYNAIDKYLKKVNFEPNSNSLCSFIEGYIDADDISSFCIWNVSLLLSLSICSNICVEMENLMERYKNNTKDSDKIILMTISKGIETIKFINTNSFQEKLTTINPTYKMMCNDPAGIFNLMDSDTKKHYIELVYEIAKRTKTNETEIVKDLLKKAEANENNRKHLGHFLMDKANITINRNKNTGAAFLILPIFFAFIFSIISIYAFKSVIISALLFFLYWEIFKGICEYFALKFTIPSFIPRMDFIKGVPENYKTCVVISALVTSPENAKKYLDNISKFYFLNRCDNIDFGVLADFKSKKQEFSKDDILIRDSFEKGLSELNEKYGNRFFALIRGRQLNTDNGQYTGWERKRGALVELVRFIKRKNTSIIYSLGSFENLYNCKYCLTLDSDTNLTMDSALELISTMAHPINEPYFDPDKKIVTKGFGILQPKLNVDLESATKTAFAKIMSGSGGIDTYQSPIGDLYQDYFDEAIFTGKGIFNIDIFYKTLDNTFPDNNILSHDLIEGSHLRCGYVSDIILTDSFPKTVISYYERLHRWIRGDWQLVKYLGNTVLNAKYEKINNPISKISKYKIFDNLRRSCIPTIAFIVLLLSSNFRIAGSLVLLLVVIFSLTFGQIITAYEAVTKRGADGITRRYHSNVLSSLKAALYQTFIQLSFLPYTAFLSVDAIFRSIWRVFISKKRLLEWVTAAQSDDKNKNSLTHFYKEMWLCPIAGAIMVLFFPPLFIIPGAMFFAAPIIAYLVSRTLKHGKYEINNKETEELLKYAKDMWRYFEDFQTCENSFLPPDNYQESPIGVVAQRTSPTNIGLGILCALSARDLGIIDTEKMYTHIENTINTIDSLKKYHGHLYNWYDTKTALPLSPKYISTVDSGNLACSLLTASYGILEYAHEKSELISLSKRIYELGESMGFDWLYCTEKKAFFIGYDAEKSEFSNSVYDIFMSEARLTSYLAISRREVNKKHWYSLARQLVKHNGFTGIVSWTGTTFEYFMPHLFLPAFENSLSFEALKFALYCQRLRAAQAGTPWGISESAYYAFDKNMNYQYKAFGVGKLGLKRWLDKELVISPYSTMMTLGFEPLKAMKNLSRMKELKLYGKYGFYEAADFTKSRVNNGFQPVKCYMSHHIGMSMISITNLLCSNNMIKRFTSDERLGAAQELLKEKIPVGAVVLNNIKVKTVPERPNILQTSSTEPFENITPDNIHAKILSNKNYSLVITDCGTGVDIFNGFDITRYRNDNILLPKGIFAFISGSDNNLRSLTFAPFYKESRKYSVTFKNDEAICYYKSKSTSAKITVGVPADVNADIRHIEISPNHNRKNLLIYTEPTLMKRSDEQSHPSFSSLFIESDMIRDQNFVYFKRRPRTSTDIELFMGAGFIEKNISYEISTSRENCASIFKNGTMPKIFEGCRHSKDTALCLKIDISKLEKGFDGHFFICFAESLEELSNHVTKLRNISNIKKSFLQAYQNNRILNGLNSADELIELNLCTHIFYPTLIFKEQTDAIRDNNNGQSELWQYGISGDSPIIVLTLDKAENAERLGSYFRVHKSLLSKGVPSDLCIICSDSGEYLRPTFRAINDMISKEKCESLLNQSNGIHVISTIDKNHTQLNTLIAAANVVFDLDKISTGKNTENKDLFEKIDLLPLSQPKISDATANIKILGGYFQCDNSFTSTRVDTVPPWCHIMANKDFGTIMSENAAGFTWCKNSRENKLTPWYNDNIIDNIGEGIFLTVQNKTYNVFNGGVTTYLPGLFSKTGFADLIEVRIKAFVPTDISSKIIICTLKSPKQVSIKLVHYFEPVLGSSTNISSFIKFNKSENVIYASNPYNSDFEGFLYSAGSGKGKIIKKSSLYNKFPTKKSSDEFKQKYICRESEQVLEPNTEYSFIYILGFDKSLSQIKSTVAALNDTNHLEIEINKVTEYWNKQLMKIQINTPNKSINALFNFWLPYQTIVSRIFGRAGNYQCGGAYGFRDQLQDVTSLLLINTDFAREHILRSAAHQFIQGDVLHWWHPIDKPDAEEKGVRTRCSDDYVWLIYAICEYIEKTEDFSILEESVPFLEGDELAPEEGDRYFKPKQGKSGTILEHCTIAARRFVSKIGPNQLALIGEGDWNDGMNMIGNEYIGESIWLSIFGAHVLLRFSDLILKERDATFAKVIKKHSENLINQVEKVGWDGDWYKRAFFDNGQPVGSKESTECKIDHLPQSFAAITGLCDKERTVRALDNAYKMLYEPEYKYVRLFTPAFNKHNPNPGYIMGYCPGLRENGGQYTHAAVWFANAFLVLNKPDIGVRLLEDIQPIWRYSTKEMAETYKTEPFVLTADIYDNDDLKGQGGWSWYTGASGWYYRVVAENLLGIRKHGNRVKFSPIIPSYWKNFSYSANLDNTSFDVTVSHSSDKQHSGVYLDGNLKDEDINLDGKAHVVLVLI